jgi:hypothetical protein
VGRLARAVRSFFSPPAKRAAALLGISEGLVGSMQSSIGEAWLGDVVAVAERLRAPGVAEALARSERFRTEREALDFVESQARDVTEGEREVLARVVLRVANATPAFRKEGSPAERVGRAMSEYVASLLPRELTGSQAPAFELWDPNQEKWAPVYATRALLRMGDVIKRKDGTLRDLKDGFERYQASGVELRGRVTTGNIRADITYDGRLRWVRDEPGLLDLEDGSYDFGVRASDGELLVHELSDKYPHSTLAGGRDPLFFAAGDFQVSGKRVVALDLTNSGHLGPGPESEAAAEAAWKRVPATAISAFAKTRSRAWKYQPGGKGSTASLSSPP